MRMRRLLFASACLLALAGCQDENEMKEGDASQGGAFKGEGKMEIALKFASDGGTRAVDDFQPGNAEESDVDDVTIFFFNEDKKYIGKGIGVVETILEGTDQDKNVEKKLQVDVPVTVMQKSPKYVAAVLNRGNFGDELLDDGTKSYDDFNAAINGSGDMGFMMTSSTYEKDGKIKDLEEIDPTVNIVERTSGKEPAPVQLYVERVAAKVDLKIGSSVEHGGANENKVEVLSWGLNVLNKKTFPIKKLETGFYGDLSGKYAEWPGKDDWNSADKHRSFWAVDPNYGDIKWGAADYSNNFELPQVSSMNTKAGTSLYCLENTFSEEAQYRRETTTAVILARFLPKGQFSNESIEEGGSYTWVQWNNQNYAKADFIYEVAGEWKAANKSYAKYYKKVGDQYQHLTDEDLDITIAEDEQVVINGKVVGAKSKPKLTVNPDVTLCIKESESSYPAASDQDAAQKEVNDELDEIIGENVSVYVNGYCYYEVQIRHFDDAEVPWDIKEDVNQAKHLGRYGIVRNHWYTINVNSILNAGKPIESETITPETEDPDDKKDYYMDVQVSVLSWAMRSQNVDL